MKRLRIDRNRVHALMKKQQIDNLKELSTRSGVSPNTLTSVLNGGSWTAKTATALAEALDCNPIDLMVADGFPDPFSAAPAHP